MMTLFILFIAAAGTWQLSAPEFQTIEMCEGFRQAAVGYAMLDARDGLTLVSQCLKESEMARWETYRGPGHEEPASGPKAGYRPLPPVYGCTPDAYGDCI